MENHNVFAGAFVDRSGEMRKDTDWLNEAMADPETRFVPVWGDHCLVGGDPLKLRLLEHHQIVHLFDKQDENNNQIFLGLFRGKPAFAVSLTADDQPPFPELGQFQELR